MLSGCVCKAGGDYCVVAKTITYSATLDTEETVHQIRQHNAVYQELCRTMSAWNKNNETE